MSTRRAYKEVTLQQMRSFAETARRGSMTAAAASLGITLPTVWVQVRALEREFAEKLIETHGRGCRLTEAGRLLAGMIGPVVAGAESLKQRFRETQAKRPARLVIASTPRIISEDLPACIVEFQRRFPHVRLVFKEYPIEGVTAAAESGEVDVGVIHDPSAWNRPLLQLEPAYELEYFLFTPLKHPLARRRQLRLKDLGHYPVVHSPDVMYPVAHAAVERLGLFQSTSRQVEASYAVTIRKFVELGFGIGFIACLPSAEAPPGLAMRPVGHLLGRVPVYFVWRRRAGTEEPAGAFAELVKTMLNVRGRKLGSQVRQVMESSAFGGSP